MIGKFSFKNFSFGGKQEPTKNTTSRNADGNNMGIFEKRSKKEKVGGEKIKEKNVVSMEPKYIAVVGLTGSGLSQFIHDVTVMAWHQITSLTQRTTQIRPVEACIGNRQITLIDTPGFVYSSGGGTRNPSGTFKDLVSWIKKKKVRLDGVIYMHDIRNTEIYGSRFIPPPDLVQLCGYSKIIFVTSHWNEIVSRGGGEEVEERVREEYWRFMVGKGSLMGRYEWPKDGERARRIVELLL